MKDSRIPLHPGTLLRIRDWIIRIDSQAGRGTTCLAYYGSVLDGEGQVLRLVVVKEFWPLLAEEGGILREGTGLRVAEETRRSRRWQQRRDQFRSCFRRQQELSVSAAMEIVVEPYMLEENENGLYLVSRMHDGARLTDVVPASLQEKLGMAIRLAELMGLLHEAGYIMPDCKPDNFLWIEKISRMTLFDADSILQYSEGIQPEALFFDSVYISPEIDRLRHARNIGWSQMRRVLRPASDLYCCGIYLFRLLLGRIPVPGEADDPDRIRRELCRLYPDSFGSSGRTQAVRKMAAILKNVLEVNPFRRCQTAQVLVEELNEELDLLHYRRYQVRKKRAAADFSYVSYDLLEKAPVCDYLTEDTRGMEAGGRRADILITGSHVFGRSLLETMIPGLVMLDTDIHLWLAGRDMEKLWESMCGARENPLLPAIVRVVNSRGRILSDYDPEVVSRPAAVVHFTGADHDRAILTAAVRTGARVFFLLREKGEENEALAERIRQEAGRDRPVKIWVIGSKDADLENSALQDPASCISRIPLYTRDGDYNENRVGSRIYDMGASIHGEYLRGIQPDITEEEILRDYASSLYNIQSSERSALRAVYTLESAGISRHDPAAPSRFHQLLRDPASADLRERLIALEHLSWTAFMVLHGGKRPESREAIAAYAYRDGNNWQDRRDPDHRIHPCICSSGPRRQIRPEHWDRVLACPFDKAGGLIDGFGLDRLDSMSLWIAALRQEAGRQGLTAAADRADLCHDFKDSDEDVILAVPGLLALFPAGGRRPAFRILRICSGRAYDDLLSAVRTGPDTLFLVRLPGTGGPGGSVDDLRACYSGYLKEAGCRTALQVIPAEALADLPRDGLYLDRGYLPPEMADAAFERMTAGLPAFHFEGSTCVMDTEAADPAGGSAALPVIMNRRICLPVALLLRMQGYTPARRDREPFTGLTDRETAALRALTADQAACDALSGLLRQMEEDRVRTLRLSGRMPSGAFTVLTDFTDGTAFAGSGLDRVFTLLQKDSLLQEGYSYPGDREYDRVSFTAREEELARLLSDMVALAEKEPLRHAFEVRILRDSVTVTDRSLYMRAVLPAGSGADALTALQQAARDDCLLRNLRITRTDTGTEVTFRYSSPSVRRILCSARDAGPALRWAEAAASGLYDDIRMASDFAVEEQGRGQDVLFLTGLIASVNGELRPV